MVTVRRIERENKGKQECATSLQRKHGERDTFTTADSDTFNLRDYTQSHS